MRDIPKDEGTRMKDDQARFVYAALGVVFATFAVRGN